MVQIMHKKACTQSCQRLDLRNVEVRPPSKVEKQGHSNLMKPQLHRLRPGLICAWCSPSSTSMTISCTVSTYLNKPVLNNASVAFVEPKASEEGSFQPIRQKFLRRCDEEFHHKHMSLMLIDHAHAHSTSRPHLHLLF